MKYLKKVITSVILFLFTIIFSNKYIVFGSAVTETYIEDFIADTYEYILFDDGETISTGYLIEGVTESYMLYDCTNSELIFYCSNARSPWTNYTSNIFSEYGLYYSNTMGYCLVNLEIDGIHDYGDVVNIEGDMEIYKKTDIELAIMYSELDSIPLDIDFAKLFPVENVVENVEIPNSYYFKNLNVNVPQNLYGTCTTIAFSTLMGYLDTFYDDDLIPDEYIEKEEVYNHYVQNTISSPGAEGYYYYLMDNVAPQTLTYKEYHFTDDSPWYTQTSTGIFNDFDTINSQMIEILKSDTTSSLYNHFNYYKHTTNINVSSSSDIFREFETLIKTGYPVVVDIIYAFDENDNIYYVNYKLGNDEWLEMVDANGIPGAHSFLCYGYLKIREIDPNTNQEKIVTYYKGHGGQKNSNGSYKYGNCLYSNRYMYNGITDDFLSEITGYTFIPKNNYHKCSENYIYNNGTCLFGICPCDSYLTSKDFFAKYSNVSLVDGKNKYYCKEHGIHLLYEEYHTHNYNISYDYQNHTYTCNTNGCLYTNTQNHNLRCSSSDGYHYNYCTGCDYACVNNSDTYVETLEQYHVVYCEICNKNVYLKHSLKYEYISGSLHRRYCEICNYSEIIPHNAYDNIIHEYIQEDGSILRRCPLCSEYVD